MDDTMGGLFCLFIFWIVLKKVADNLTVQRTGDTDYVSEGQKAADMQEQSDMEQQQAQMDERKGSAFKIRNELVRRNLSASQKVLIWVVPPWNKVVFDVFRFSLTIPENDSILKILREKKHL